MNLSSRVSVDELALRLLPLWRRLLMLKRIMVRYVWFNSPKSSMLVKYLLICSWICF